MVNGRKNGKLSQSNPDGSMTTKQNMLGWDETPSGKQALREGKTAGKLSADALGRRLIFYEGANLQFVRACGGDAWLNGWYKRLNEQDSCLCRIGGSTSFIVVAG
jgi:hypothetical protein